MRSSIFGMALLVGLAPLARAADEPKATPSKGAYVVVVGGGETADPTIKPRTTAEGDAKALFKLLTDKNYFKVKPERAKLLTGKEATREAIVKAMTDAVSQSGDQDTVILAYFGRATSAGDSTCFFAADSTFKDRTKNAVLGSDLQTALKGSKEQRLALFLDIGKVSPDTPAAQAPLTSLIPAFMISELRRAFEIGFLLFVPFLIIDMVVASILMSMGMMMLPPVQVSLPFKLIFFVLVDGWYLVVGSLVRSFGQG